MRRNVAEDFLERCRRSRHTTLSNADTSQEEQHFIYLFYSPVSNCITYMFGLEKMLWMNFWSVIYPPLWTDISALVQRCLNRNKEYRKVHVSIVCM